MWDGPLLVRLGQRRASSTRVAASARWGHTTILLSVEHWTSLISLAVPTDEFLALALTALALMA